MDLLRKRQGERSTKRSKSHTDMEKPSEIFAAVGKHHRVIEEARPMSVLVVQGHGRVSIPVSRLIGGIPVHDLVVEPDGY